MRLLARLALLVLGSSTVAAGELARPEDLRALVRLPGSEVRVEVRAGSANADAAVRFLATAVRALPRLAEEIGWPLGASERIVIEVRVDASATGGYAGTNRGRRILILETATDSDLVHELAHCWFTGTAFEDFARGDRWLCEGLSEWATWRVLNTEPSLGDPVDFQRAALQRLDEYEAEFGPLAPLLDRQPLYPLPPELEPQAHALAFYGSAFLFLSLLEDEIGAPALRRALWGSRLGGRFRSRAFLGEVSREFPATLGCTRGWLVAGTPPAAFLRTELSDADGDGLRAGHERRLGTSDDERDSDGDGLPDALELLLLGSDPAGVEPWPASLERAFWSRGTLAARPGEALWDPSSDLAPASPAWGELSGFGVRADEHFLYARFLFPAPPIGEPAGVAFVLGFDADADDVFEETLTVNPGGTPYLSGLGPGGVWGPPRSLPLAEIRRGPRFLGLAIPRAALRVEGALRVFGGSTFLEGERSLFADQVGWLPLELR